MWNNYGFLSDLQGMSSHGSILVFETVEDEKPINYYIVKKGLRVTSLTLALVLTLPPFNSKKQSSHLLQWKQGQAYYKQLARCNHDWKTMILNWSRKSIKVFPFQGSKSSSGNMLFYLSIIFTQVSSNTS